MFQQFQDYSVVVLEASDLFLQVLPFLLHTVKEVEANPDNYDHDSVKAMNTAKIVAMSILIINLLYFGMTIYRISTVGWDEIMQQSEQMMEEWGNQ